MKLKHLLYKQIYIFLQRFNLEVKKIKKTDDLYLYDETVRPKFPRYINIGAGGFYHPFWHNIDMPNEYYDEVQKRNLHIPYDITAKNDLQIESSSVKIAYTSHVIEHISNDCVEFLFDQVYRCLQKGGVFRITCPDMELEYKAYMNNDRTFWRWKNAYGISNDSIQQMFLDHFATILTNTHPEVGVDKLSDAEFDRIMKSMNMADAFDKITSMIPKEIAKKYPGDHVNWFTEEKLTNMLTNAGFKHVVSSRFGQSCSPILRNTTLFDNTVPVLSLYVEAYKK